MTTMGDRLFIFGGGPIPDDEKADYSNSMHVLHSELCVTCM